MEKPVSQPQTVPDQGGDDKAAELVQELNAFAEHKYQEGLYADAEERFRAALGVYKEWAINSDNIHTVILTTIAGLVKTLEAQGRNNEAGEFLEQEESTITSVIGMLRRVIP
jgi:hypothetical protein